MSPDNQTTDNSRQGVEALNSKNDRDGLTAASFAEYSSKRDRQPFQFMNSPAKRTKISSLSGHVSPPLSRVKSQNRLVDNEFDPFRNTQLLDASNGLPRKNYIKDSDRGNSLRRTVRLAAGIDAVTEAAAENLTISDRHEDSTNPSHLHMTNKGIRLSKAPPFPIGFEDTDESPLPPTVKQGHASPDTIKRGLEEIYSSGKRKAHHEGIDFGSTPESPTRKLRLNSSRDLTDHYYPALYTSIKDKGHRMFLEHREALQREVSLLGDELVVERRKASIGKGLKAAVSPSNEIFGFITQCLDVNDEEITRNLATVQVARELETGLRSTLPRAEISSQYGVRDLSTLTFTNYNNSAQDLNPGSLNSRSLQGYSHESLLHFKATMEVVLIAGPIVNSLKVECSDWARMELGHTLSRLSAERNISTALYSISSYAALARRRAECWVLLQNQFPKLIPATTQPEPSLKPTQPSEDGSKVARRLLVANLPRRKMTFQGRNAFSNAPISSETEVCLYWHINVKTTGESYSNVSANIKVLSGDSGEIRVTQQMSNLFKVIVGEYGFMEGSSRLLDTIFGNS